MEKKTRQIDGVKIKTFKKDIVDANILSVEVGTNGAQGGDSGHGSRTYFNIKNGSSTDFDVNIIYGSYTSDILGFEVKLGGDSELRTIKEAFKFFLQVLDTYDDGDYHDEDE